MGVNKVILGNENIIDISDSSVSTSNLLANETAYDASGTKIVGLLPNVGSQNALISTVSQEIAPSIGYHNGNGSIKIDPVEQAKIIPGNIKKDIQILGVTGTVEEGIDTSDATATAGDVLSGKTAYVNGSKITGTIESQAGGTYGASSTARTIITAPKYITSDVKLGSISTTNLTTNNILRGKTIAVYSNGSSVASATGSNSVLKLYTTNLTGKTISTASNITGTRVNYTNSSGSSTITTGVYYVTISNLGFTPVMAFIYPNTGTITQKKTYFPLSVLILEGSYGTGFFNMSVDKSGSQGSPMIYIAKSNLDAAGLTFTSSSFCFPIATTYTSVSNYSTSSNYYYVNIFGY